MKKYLIITIIYTTIILPATVFAAPTSKASAATNSPATSNSTASQEVITNWKNRADLEINRRLTALSGLTNKIDNLKKLTSSQRSTFDSDINAQISSLNALKSKIDAETDTATLKTDIQSILDSYRIFAFYIPKIHILAAADKILTTATNLTNAENNLQTVMTTITDQNQLEKAKTYYANYDAQIYAANTAANSAISAVLSLTPNGYPDNKSVMESAYQQVVSARKDLLQAVADGKEIVNLAQ